MVNFGSCILFFSIYILCITSSQEIPSFIPLCKRNDPKLSKCVIQAVEKIRPYLKKGIPEMNLPPGDPLHFYNTTTNTGKGTSVSLEASSWDQIATGITDFEIQNIMFDFDNAKCFTTLVFPFVRLEGQYKFKGKVLLFTIDTTGNYQINSTNVVSQAEFIGKYHIKNGRQYLQFTKINLDLKLPNIKVYFGNLINGNKLLTNTLNKSVNENIDGIIDELLPLIGEILGSIARLYFNSVFDLFSIDQLFPMV